MAVNKDGGQFVGKLFFCIYNRVAFRFYYLYPIGSSLIKPFCDEDRSLVNIVPVTFFSTHRGDAKQLEELS
jgi:hypothetical protein